LHVRTAHLGLRPYVCDVAECGLDFSHKHVLLRHLRVVHGRRRGVGGGAASAGAGHSGDEESGDTGMSGDEDEDEDEDEEDEEEDEEDEHEHDAVAESSDERFGSTVSADSVAFNQPTEPAASSHADSRVDATGAIHLQHESAPPSSLKRTHMAANA
jgi:hypothetical protein